RRADRAPPGLPRAGAGRRGGRRGRRGRRRGWRRRRRRRLGRVSRVGFSHGGRARAHAGRVRSDAAAPPRLVPRGGGGGRVRAAGAAPPAGAAPRCRAPLGVARQPAVGAGAAGAAHLARRRRARAARRQAEEARGVPRRPAAPRGCGRPARRRAAGGGDLCGLESLTT
ncbi:hypothetical protein EMIHUDRAFT_423848, partial [Emiliania huxleyi CCMP1516]|uniref:Uncharacterized protein n=2 Tax=Emiliania huxleyi TaxID=2903 RepID=A0A0D3K7D6_EMIH1